tara:strand:+ start:655 stop:1119 length:465 start_codon:yes stop_codon:yes gene_type:complete
MNFRFVGLTGIVVTALTLCSCLTSEPRADVQVTPGTKLGDYQIVYFVFEDAWAANHSIVQLLQQEFQRRSFAIKVGPPLEEDKSISTVLRLKHAGENKDSQKGSVTSLRYLRFDLTDASSGKLLASVNRDHGSDMDPIEQKLFAKALVDDLLDG